MGTPGDSRQLTHFGPHPPGLRKADSAPGYSKPPGAQGFLFSDDLQLDKAGFSPSWLLTLQHLPLRNGR